MYLSEVFGDFQKLKIYYESKMKIFCNFILLVMTFCFYARIIDCSGPNFSKIINVKNFYQITSYVSDNFTKIFDHKKLLFRDSPRKTYSFNSNVQMAENYYFKNSLRNKYSSQESLVTFYMNNLGEINTFIDFLVHQSTVRKLPKCLIVYLSNGLEFIGEINVINSLKYSWKNKFLDFSILVTNLENEIIDVSPFIYYLNPFENVIYRKKLDEKKKYSLINYEMLRDM